MHYQLSLEREASLDYCKDCTIYVRGEAETTVGAFRWPSVFEIM